MDENQWRNEYVALDAPPTVQTTQQPSPELKPKKRIPWKWIAIVVLFLVALGVGLLLLRKFMGGGTSSSEKIGQVKVQEVDLGNLSNVATPLKLDSTDKVVINGQLQTTQGLLLTPTVQPTNAVLGQVYLDSQTREIKYYNGTGFVALATTDQQALTQAEVLALISGNQLELPQDLSVTASPQFAGLKLNGSGGNSVLLQAAAGTNNVTLTLPANSGSANQCLTTDGNGVLSFSACAIGSGNAFLQGGNAFATAAVLGTTDSNALNFITNNTTRLSISASGNVGIGNSTPANKLVVNSPTTADSAAQTVIATGAAANKGLVIQGIIFQSGNLMEIQQYTGSSLFSVSAEGVAAFRTATNSATGFQVQNAAGTSVLNVDTTNQRVGIGTTSPAYKLDVNGDVNIVGTSALRIGGTIVCTASGCDSQSGSGFYIQNSNGIQSNANFAIQSANSGYVGGVIRGAASQTADLLQLQVSSGTNVLSVGATGNVLVQPSSNSTTAFRIQNAAGSSNLFIADTTNTRIGIGIAPSYTLDVNGDINIASANALRIGGTLICDSTGCDSSSGSGFYIQNGTGIQSSANFAIQSANASYVGGIIRGAASQTADLLQLQNSAGTNVLSVSATGAVVAQNTTNSTGAFLVKNAAGTANVLVVDTVNNRVGINEYPSGYALDVNGDANLDNSGALRINGNVVCDINGCSASSGSGNYIQNGNGVQTNANFAIQSANVGYVGGLIRGAASQTADLFQVQNSSTTNLFKVTANGESIFQNASNVSEAFAVKNSGGTSLLSVDTSSGTVYATNTSGNALIGTTSNSSSYGVTGTQSAGVGGGVKGVGGGGYGVLGQSASNASGLFQTTDTANLNTVATLITRGQTNQTTANVFEAQNTAGTSTFSIGYAGAVLAKNSTDSTTAFQIQNAAGNNYLLVNTSGASISVGNAGVASTIQIGNTTGAVAQTVNIGNNTTASSTTTTTVGSIVGSSGTTIQGGTAGTIIKTGTAGSATEFQIQNAASSALLNVSSTALNVTSSTAEVAGTWSTSTAMSVARFGHTALISGSRIYAIGGSTGSYDATVYYSSIKADGTLPGVSSTGYWQQTSANMPTAVVYGASGVSGNYVYVTGGFNTAADSNPSVYTYIGKLDTNGNITRWDTSGYKLDTAVAAAASVIHKGYLYIIGGSTTGSGGAPTNGGATTKVQYARIYPDGSIGSFTASSYSIPAGVVGARAVVANGKIYVVGGLNSSGTAQTSIYYADISSTGDIASSGWQTSANTLPAGRAYHGVVNANGRMYVLGGGSSATSGNNTVYYAQYNFDGTIGTFATSANTLSSSTVNFGYAMANGYIYAVGGYSGAATTTVQYASLPRVSIGTSLDLVGLNGLTMDDGGLGGSLTAGNTNIVGRLSVTQNADFMQGINVRGDLAVGGEAAFRNSTDSEHAFTIQSAGGISLLQANTISQLDVDNNLFGLQGVIQPGVSAAFQGATRSVYYHQFTNYPTLSPNNGAANAALAGDGKPLLVTALSNGSGIQYLALMHCATIDCSTTTTQVNTYNTPNIPPYTTIGTNSLGLGIGKTNNGLPVIAFKYGSNVVVWNCGDYACSSGNVFTTLPGATGASNLSMTMGANGLPVIVNQGSAGSRPQVTFCTNDTPNAKDTCSSSTTTTFSAGQWSTSMQNGSAVAIGNDGYPIIAAGKSNCAGTGSKECVTIAKCNNSDCTSVTTTEVPRVVSGVYYNAGKAPQIVIDPSDGLPIVANIDADNSVVQYFKCSTISCSSQYTHQTLGPAGQVSNANLSLVIGGDGLPVMTFKDNTSTAYVGILHCGTALCDPNATGSQANTYAQITPGKSNGGAQPTIMIGPNNYPKVFYYAGTTTGPSYHLGFLNCVDYTCASTANSVLSGGISLGIGDLAFANIGVDQINSGRPNAKLKLDSAGNFSVGALSVAGASGSTSGSVIVSSNNTSALQVINKGTLANVLSVDSSNNSVNIGTSTSVTNYGLNSAYAALFRNATNTTSQVAIQNASSTSLFNVDSTNNRIGLFNSLSAISAPTGLSVGAATAGGSLTASAVYRYKVTALDAAGGESGASSEASGTVGSAGTQTLPVTWTAVTGASGYKVYRTAANGAADSQVYLTTVLTNSFTDSGSIAAGTATPPSSGTAYTSTNSTNALLQLSVGGNGTPTGQVYVSGVVPSAARGTVTAGTIPVYVAVQGRYAYVINQTSATLQVYDVNNKIAPTLVGSVSTGTLPRGIAVQGRYAYVVNQTSNTLQVFDISNPSSPSLTGTMTTGLGPIALRVRGRYAYIVNSSSNSFQIIDINNPANPVSVGVVTTNTLPRSITVQGNYAYITNFTSGSLQVIDISNVASPTVTGTVTTNISTPREIAVQGRYAYIANSGANNMLVFDISNPSSPTYLSTLTTGTTPYAIAVQGRYAYITNFNSFNMQTVDISNPAAPFSVGTSTTVVSGVNGAPNAIAVAGRFAYVTNQTTNAFMIFDLGGMYTQTVEAGSAEFGSVNVSGTSTFVGDASFQGGGNFGGTLQVGGNFGIAGNGMIQGSLSVAGGVQGGLTISGVSAPAAPTVTSRGTTGATTYSYTVTAMSATGGESTASSAGTTVNGNATLSSSNYNEITWTPVAGAVNYRVYRTVGGATQGLLATTGSTYYFDQGAAGSGSAPTSDTTGSLNVTGNSLFKPATNGASAFKVQNAAGSVDLFAIDTSGNGTISIQAAADSGAINIGTANSITVTIGKSGGTGTLVVNGNSTINGTLTVNGHVLSGNTSGSTTIAAQTAQCGTGCTASISGNDTAGLITLNTGTGAAAGIQATVTFATAYGSAPRIIITPNTVPAASTYPQYHVTSATTTFDLLVYTALTDSKTYTFTYIIIQ